MGDLDTTRLLYCPKCGHQFKHTLVAGGKAGAVGIGTALGAKVGFGAGIAILGTAVTGAWVAIPVFATAGYLLGKKASDPRCPKCAAKFSV